MCISMVRCNNMVSRAENQAHVSEICMVDNYKLIIYTQNFYILFSIVMTIRCQLSWNKRRKKKQSTSYLII